MDRFPSLDTGILCQHRVPLVASLDIYIGAPSCVSLFITFCDIVSLSVGGLAIVSLLDSVSLYKCACVCVCVLLHAAPS